MKNNYNDKNLNNNIEMYDLFINEEAFQKIKNNVDLNINENDILKLIEDYKYDLVKIESLDIKNTMLFYQKSNINYERYIYWFPAGLSIDICYVIYKYMNSNKVEKDKIIDLLLGNFSKTLDIYNKIRKIIKKQNINYFNDKEFLDFMIEIFETINTKKYKTESFKKLYNNLKTKNEEVIKRLK